MWDVITLGGDVAVQRAVQRAVHREGGDREDLGREGFAARARQLEAQAETDLQHLFDHMGLRADLSAWRGGSEEAARTARIAFVRLYEAGLLSRTDAVIDSCPSCETVVDIADANEVEVDAEVARIAVPNGSGMLEIDLIEPELLIGAVAVAVPAHFELEDKSVFLPLLEQVVPIVAVHDLEQPVIVVPGHDRWSYELARQLNFNVREVMDAEGIVRQPGLLEGLGRHAARSTAIERLAADGHLIAHIEGRQVVNRCHRCGTVLVPLLGRHWILPLSELVAPVVEAVNAGELTFSPGSAAQLFLDAAERAGVWAVSQQLWAGLPIPVFTCLDCGQTQVSVENETSCGSCMGTLEAHNDVLDGRFIAAVTPLAMLGWPQQSIGDDVFSTILVGRAGLETWALPVAALALRLSGRLPYAEVMLYHQAVYGTELGVRPIAEIITAVEQFGVEVVRAALLNEDFDLEKAAEHIEILNQPRAGIASSSEIAEAYELSVTRLRASDALSLLLDLASRGVAADQVEEVQRLAEPLLALSANAEIAGMEFDHT